MDKFNLKKYLAEGKLYEEEIQNEILLHDIVVQ